MNIETKKAIKGSIKHWEIMRRWVKKQDKKNYVSQIQMKISISMVWFGDDCALCDTYAAALCLKCPLAKKYMICGTPFSAWNCVTRSKTWGEWYKHSTLMLKQLRSLL